LKLKKAEQLSVAIKAGDKKKESGKYKRKLGTGIYRRSRNLSMPNGLSLALDQHNMISQPVKNVSQENLRTIFQRRKKSLTQISSKVTPIADQRLIS
jgi:hypothetical protein